MPCRQLAREFLLIGAADGGFMRSLCHAADLPIIAEVLVLLTVAAGGGGAIVQDESGACRCRRSRHLAEAPLLKTSKIHTADTLALSLDAVAVALLPSLSLCDPRLMPALSISCRPSLLPAAVAPVLKASIYHAAGMLSLPLVAVAVALLPTLGAGACSALQSSFVAGVDLLQSFAAASGCGAIAQEEHMPHRRTTRLKYPTTKMRLTATLLAAAIVLLASNDTLSVTASKATTKQDGLYAELYRVEDGVVADKMRVPLGEVEQYKESDFK
ncbi:hypothetical protein PF008_g11586 [Phytophthora fragariae]|uniref:Uncharacterized protein n=2 Tax=Phytophthora TaxID=4783 RepID=A0A6G0RQW4_9STRA|nr:hypothetical protein PF008_g11586 [Phytophthora fragariae]